MTKLRTRFLLISAILILFTLTASAQGVDFGSSSFQAEENLLQYMNQVLLTYEVNSIGEFFFFFLLPLAGFYLINTNIFELGFESFETRIGRDNYVHTRDDEVPTGLKGIALVAAFMTVQVAGVFGTFLILIASSLAFVSWFLNQVGLLGDWSNGGNGNGGDGGGNGEVERDEVENMINEAVGDMEDAEDDIDEGNARDAEDEIEAALSAFSGAEKGIMDILSMDTSKLDDAILKVENASHKVGELEKDDVATLKELFEELDHKIMELKNLENNDLSSTPPVTDITTNFTDKWADMNSPTPIKQLVHRIEEETGLIARGEKSADENLTDAIDEMLEAAEDLIRIKKFEEEISEDLGRLANDEERLKEVVRASGANQGLIQRLVNEKEQIENLKQNLRRIDNYDTEHKVAAALNKLEEFLEIQQSEQEDIEDIYEKLVTDDEKIEKLYTTLTTVYDPHPTLDTFEDELAEVEAELEGQIKDDLDTIKTQIAVHGNHVSQAYQKLQNLNN